MAAPISTPNARIVPTPGDPSPGGFVFFAVPEGLPEVGVRGAPTLVVEPVGLVGVVGVGLNVGVVASVGDGEGDIVGVGLGCWPMKSPGIVAWSCAAPVGLAVMRTKSPVWPEVMGFLLCVMFTVRFVCASIGLPP